eukprot:6534969-Prymnesium_polylepis.3
MAERGGKNSRGLAVRVYMCARYLVEVAQARSSSALSRGASSWRNAHGLEVLRMQRPHEGSAALCKLGYGGPSSRMLSNHHLLPAWLRARLEAEHAPYPMPDADTGPGITRDLLLAHHHLPAGLCALTPSELVPGFA